MSGWVLDMNLWREERGELLPGWCPYINCIEQGDLGVARLTPRYKTERSGEIGVSSLSSRHELCGREKGREVLPAWLQRVVSGRLPLDQWSIGRPVGQPSRPLGPARFFGLARILIEAGIRLSRQVLSLGFWYLRQRPSSDLVLVSRKNSYSLSYYVDWDASLISFHHTRNELGL